MVKRNDTVSDDTGQEITGATCSKPTSLRVSPSILKLRVKTFPSTLGGFSGSGNSKMTSILVSGQQDRKWSNFVVTDFLLDSRVLGVEDNEYETYFDGRPS